MIRSRRVSWLAALLVVCAGASARAQTRGHGASSAPPPSSSAPPSSAAPSSGAPADEDEEPIPAEHVPSDDSGEGSAAQSEGTQEPAAQAEEEEPQEPAAPAEAPVAQLTPEQQARLQPSVGELTDREASGAHRFLFPPYLEEWGRGHHTRIVFPVYYENHYQNEHRYLVPPYYRTRSPRMDVDVFAPLFFQLRGHENGATWTTTVLPPFWHHTSRGPGRAHAFSIGFAPLFSYNETFGPNGRLLREHLVLPGVYHQWWPQGQMTVVGPVVYFRHRGNTNWAVVPFVFGHSDVRRTWTLIPPLLTYRNVDHENNRTFTLVGPFFSETGPNLSSYNFAPIFFHRHEGQNTRVTLVPLFHTQSSPNGFTLITPLGGYTREGNESTLILPLYQNHRGRTDLDAIAPLFFYSRTPSIGAHTVVVGPVFHSSSNTGYAWGLFPLLGRIHEYGRYDTTLTPLFVHSEVFTTRTSTTWVFPSIHRESAPDHGFFNIYPLLFTAHGRGWHHNVFFPLVWDVGSEQTGSQITVVAPFFVRVADRRSMTQWVFPNHVYWESRSGGRRTSFGWDFFPFVQYGEPRQGDNYWSILEGLVGYRRQGSYQQMRIFYIPFGIGGTPPRSSGAPAQATSGAPAQATSGARSGDSIFAM